MATRVLPSPVFISAMLPRWSAAPPMSCTSKWRRPRVRRGGLAHGGEGLGQQVVEALAVFVALAQLDGVSFFSSSSVRSVKSSSRALIAFA